MQASWMNADSLCYNAEEADWDDGEGRNWVHTTTTPLLTGKAVVQLLSNSTPVDNVEARAAKLRLGMELCFGQEYILLEQIAVSDEQLLRVTEQAKVRIASGESDDETIRDKIAALAQFGGIGETPTATAWNSTTRTTSTADS